MKNLWNSVTKTLDRISHMTRLQQVILIGSIILPGGSLILIFSQFGRRIIRELMKAKTSRTFGKLISEQELIEQLYEKSKPIKPLPKLKKKKLDERTETE